MRITRFVTPDNEIVYGEDEGDGRALVLSGDPWSGFETSGKRMYITERLAPVDPVNIFCIGLNYRAHAEETGAALPVNPVIFMKPTTALNHPDNEIVLPACCRDVPEVDFEAELAVVIGKAARNVSEEDALDYVLGYTCANDVSARRWQKHGGGGQWVKGKSFDSFCPLGPVLVTTDEITDPQTLRVESLLNGKVMQDGHTSDMIFPVARLIHLLSQDTTLLPGTVILTGTPAGVGFARKPPVFLAEGDRIEVRINAIGVLANTVVQG
ncbi:MAG: fumarylacetoacetate hydrolase family protein [Gammaproteobacteria bacterium]|nr:fumarylacetoacetate hydrolase family protein [Gammaproteobacteria bacterium]MCB1851680.1 fumarylacetoacetate hydrolase family protein [Gammaproteobacteria bacterium]MCP5416207.1 fumarylacetoacetate hydrolase family protein [Chromatiaceae bacterium]